MQYLSQVLPILKPNEALNSTQCWHEAKDWCFICLRIQIKCVVFETNTLFINVKEVKQPQVWLVIYLAGKSNGKNHKIVKQMYATHTACHVILFKRAKVTAPLLTLSVILVPVCNTELCTPHYEFVHWIFNAIFWASVLLLVLYCRHRNEGRNVLLHSHNHVFFAQPQIRDFRTKWMIQQSRSLTCFFHFCNTPQPRDLSTSCVRFTLHFDVMCRYCAGNKRRLASLDLG